jgi:hypothetical protein
MQEKVIILGCMEGHIKEGTTEAVEEEWRS